MPRILKKLILAVVLVISLNVSANMFSKKAIEKIESAGGTVNFI